MSDSVIMIEDGAPQMVVYLPQQDVVAIEDRTPDVVVLEGDSGILAILDAESAGDSVVLMLGDAFPDVIVIEPEADEQLVLTVGEVGPRGPQGTQGIQGERGIAGSTGTAGFSTPHHVPDGETFLVADNIQVLSAMPFTLDGSLLLDGFFVELL